jgi:hypothetical protein
MVAQRRMARRSMKVEMLVVASLITVILAIPDRLNRKRVEARVNIESGRLLDAVTDLSRSGGGLRTL